MADTKVEHSSWRRRVGLMWRTHPRKSRHLLTGRVSPMRQLGASSCIAIVHNSPKLTHGAIRRASIYIHHHCYAERNGNTRACRVETSLGTWAGATVQQASRLVSTRHARVRT